MKLGVVLYTRFYVWRILREKNAKPVVRTGDWKNRSIFGFIRLPTSWLTDTGVYYELHFDGHEKLNFKAPFVALKSTNNIPIE
jgi:hypothetical protein